MTLFVVAFLGGMLTVLSPCILPVLPFVFSRTDRPFVQGSLPLLMGLATAFATVASLGAVAGAWAGQLNEWGRWIALVSLALFAVSLIAPRFVAWWSGPLVRAGERLARIETGSPWLTSAVLGAATGLIWSPCAGPVLGVILSGAAVAGATPRSFLLLLSYGSGAAVALGVALRLGARTLASLKAWRLYGAFGRHVMGTVMLAGVVAVATGVDTTVLARLSSQDGSGIEAQLVQRAMPTANAAESAGDRKLARRDPVTPRPSTLPVESSRASFDGGNWLNADPQSIPSLRGKVVLVNFWTYSCVNCLRTLPYVKAWEQKYADQGLVVVGVHTPEFAFEKEAAREAGAVPTGATPATKVDTSGLGMAADPETLRSGETYLGYEKARGLRVSVDPVPDQALDYKPAALLLNTWSLAGNWTVGPELVESHHPGNVLAVRFQARDANLVLGSASNKPVRFRLTLDGQAPGPNHGSDVDAQGNGVIEATRLYQLVRQVGAVQPRTVEIQFLDAGARGYAFTFG
jgi:cytochrome c biogenesis protein CcdA/thiol-disulfide isomerase/thioredoxin